MVFSASNWAGREGASLVHGALETFLHGLRVGRLQRGRPEVVFLSVIQEDVKATALTPSTVFMSIPLTSAAVALKVSFPPSSRLSSPFDHVRVPLILLGSRRFAALML